MASISMLQMRAYIKQQYPYYAWAVKVDKMSEKQVVATYMRFINEASKEKKK